MENISLQTPSPEENSTTESATSPKHAEAKRKYSEMDLDGDASEDSEEESITTKIERLGALDDSLADEDYNVSWTFNKYESHSYYVIDSTGVLVHEFANYGEADRHFYDYKSIETLRVDLYQSVIAYPC